MKRTLFAATLLAAAPLHAQPALSVDASYHSGYVARGLSLTTRPVAQGTAALSLPVAGLTFSGGAWANLEVASYTRAGDVSMTAGEGGANLTEVDLWADVSRAFGPVSATAGVLRMTSQQGGVHPRLQHHRRVRAPFAARRAAGAAGVGEL